MPVRNKRNIPSRYILFALTTVAILLLFFSYATGFSGGVFEEAAAYIFVPMEKGITYVSNAAAESSKDRETKAALQAENADLQSQVEKLREDNTKAKLEQEELARLRTLLELKDTYNNYQTTGAHVIAKSQSNWFNTFTIDKGTSDGIEKDMNVIAGGGLCGIVTDVGSHYAIVKAIVDDTANVSAMVVSSQDNCIVSGSLQSMTEEGTIKFSNLQDEKVTAAVGDPVVTSNISSEYVPGVLIGYLTSIEADSNNLTKSGKITPVCDFRHLSEVLVILQQKENAQ